MRFFGVVFFIALLTGSWAMFNSTSAVGVSTHISIQDQLANFIVNTVKEKKPNVSQVDILKIYSEKINSQQILVHYTYSYFETLNESEESEQVFTGVITLDLVTPPTEENQRWMIKNVKTDKVDIEFKVGSIISPMSQTEAHFVNEDAGEDISSTEERVRESATASEVKGKKDLLKPQKKSTQEKAPEKETAPLKERAPLKEEPTE